MPVELQTNLIRKGHKPSLLDYVMSYASNSMDSVETIENYIVDHAFVKIVFQNDIIKSNPQLKGVRDTRNLNAENLMNKIVKNT